MIKEFRGRYRFLSNFYPSPFEYDGNIYPTNEHFFQAMKTLIREERIAISKAAKSGIAKWMASPDGYNGFKITLRPDWEQIKVEVMLFGLRKKFSDENLAKKLIATYPQQLVEGNWWNDRVWGIDLKTGVGQNLLGKCLGEVRFELINAK